MMFGAPNSTWPVDGTYCNTYNFFWDYTDELALWQTRVGPWVAFNITVLQNVWLDGLRRFARRAPSSMSSETMKIMFSLL